MVETLITLLMLIVAAIHLVPITGFFGARRLSALYGIEVDSPDLEILMRHRAALFGILGTFFAYAAFVPAVQPIAFGGAAASLAFFFYLAFVVGNFGDKIRKIVLGDVIAVVALIAAVALYVTKTA
ncbi:MAG: hypothetical protein WCE62_00375 [Polyangiales bacterium]